MENRETPPWVEHDTIASSRTDARSETDYVRPKPKKQGAVGALLSGGILSRTEVRRTYPYMLFVVALMFYYIAYAFAGQRIYRTHAGLTEEVKELRAKSMTIASEKMQATRQSHIIVELARRGIPLRETLTPNKVIPKDDGKEAQDDR